MEDKTMKKTYITPNMDVIKMTTAQMLAGSMGTNNTPQIIFGDALAGDGDDDAD